MRVLKEGNWNDPWSREMDCPTCKAKLLVEEGDLKPNEYDAGFSCRCALCSKPIQIHPDKICQRLREALEAMRPRRHYSSGRD